MSQQKITSIKIQAAQAQIESVGHRFKHLSVALHGSQTISQVLETPEAWTAVQGDRMRHLSKGDQVTLISADGETVCEGAMVTKAEAGSVWFSKPLRLIQLEPVALFEDRMYRVVPRGVGYAVQNIRDGRTEEKVFASVEAAKVDIVKRQPVKLAS